MRSLDKKEFRTKVCGQCACGCGCRWSEPLQSKRSANRKARKNAKILCRKALTVQALCDIVFIEREVITMKVWFYRFVDGYTCWTVGKMSRSDIKWEETTHGKLVEQKVFKRG